MLNEARDKADQKLKEEETQPGVRETLSEERAQESAGSGESSAGSGELSAGPGEPSAGDLS